jgi:phytanoyl-CoA hydroxylase
MSMTRPYFPNTRLPEEVIYPGWIDAPGSLDLLGSLNLSELEAGGLRDLIVDGFTVLPGLQDPILCDSVVADYAQFSAERLDFVAKNIDVLGREKRLVNFHLWSDHEMQICTNPCVMAFLDLIFGEPACVYTSLTFKYGTQQPIHRDTPHFATWPQNRFCGVWTALEDISPQAGPLMYIRGGHRFEVDHRQIMRDVMRNRPNLSPGDQAMLALDLYNGRIIDESPGHGELVIKPVNKGDVVIWHAQTPHGGAPAADPFRSRWSVVAHCAPVSIQVHQHDRFFMHQSDEAPPPRYGYGEAYGRKIAVSGETAFM